MSSLRSLLLVTATVTALHAPVRVASAAEPDIPEHLVTAADALAGQVRQKAAEMPPQSVAAIGGGDRDDRLALAAFYADRGGKPVWLDAEGAGFTARARDAMAEIRRAVTMGSMPAPSTCRPSPAPVVAAMPPDPTGRGPTARPPPRSSCRSPP